MRSPSEVGIPTSICGGNVRASGPGGDCSGNVSGWSALNNALQNIQNFLSEMAKGEGSVLRFRLTEKLSPGGQAGADIYRFDATGYVKQRDGVVFDEIEYWRGLAGDYGWCTLRDGSDGNYSVIVLPATLGLSSSTGAGTGNGGASRGGDYTTDSNALSQAFAQYGAEAPPLGVWNVWGTLTQTLTFGGTANMTLSGTNITIPVHDYLLQSGQTVASGKKVMAAWDIVTKRYNVASTQCSS